MATGEGIISVIMKILCSVPNTGWIHKLVNARTDALLLDGRYTVKIIRPTHNPYENSLHHIINDFMAGNFHYWLNIDADNPPVNNPLNLVKLDLDIVGLPTPIWHFTDIGKGERPMYWNGFKWNAKKGGYNEWPVKEGLQEVDAVGTGCFLINRRVFNHPEMRKAPFQRTYFEDGRVEFGNDMAFCQKAKKNGFKIHAHYDYPCDHMKELPLNEVSKAIQGMTNGSH